jgi:hypothetical protein
MQCLLVIVMHVALMVFRSTFLSCAGATIQLSCRLSTAVCTAAGRRNVEEAMAAGRPKHMPCKGTIADVATSCVMSGALEACGDDVTPANAAAAAAAAATAAPRGPLSPGWI